MKVLLVTPGYPPRVGGIETVTANLARGLAAAGDEVVVLTPGGPRSSRETEEDGIRIRRVASIGRAYELSVGIGAAIRDECFDVCHSHSIHSMMPAAAHLAGAHPHVVTGHFHGHGHTRTARILHVPYRPLARRVVAAADGVTAVSEYEAHLMEAAFGIVPEVIPNGLDVDAVRRVPRIRFDGSDVRLLAVGRLEPYKRMDLAIGCLSALPPDHRLTIIGRGSQSKGLRRLAAELGVADRVVIEERRIAEDDLYAEFRNADVCLTLSGAEAFSLVVLESLAAGTPVVVSGDGALREWPIRFPNAVVAPEQLTVAGIADAVDTLAGRRAEVDLQAFSWPAVVDRMRGLYAKVTR
jgi:glycosyltransferase involved in cell wall biosynthesis